MALANEMTLPPRSIQEYVPGKQLTLAQESFVHIDYISVYKKVLIKGNDRSKSPNSTTD